MIGNQAIPWPGAMVWGRSSTNVPAWLATSRGVLAAGATAKHNVTSFEVHPVPGRPEVMGGVLHSFALSKDCRESRTGLHDFFAVVPGGLKIVGGCFVETRDFDPVRIQSVNATALFGAGWIDRISSKSIVHQSRSKVVAGDRQGAPGRSERHQAGPGRACWPDGRIGKFGWKAQFATLEEFVASACANELGLGNPLMEQAKPWAHHAYYEGQSRPGPEHSSARWWHSSTRCPARSRSCHSTRRNGAVVERGKTLFEQVGCAAAIRRRSEAWRASTAISSCIESPTPERSGQRLRRGPQHVQLPDDHPLPDEWKTPPLWGVADSAPYFHDGGSPTLETAILSASRRRGERHQGIRIPLSDRSQRRSSAS